jgi:23S rRNA-intervening sequence protein
MPTVTRFEDLEIWELARKQTNGFDAIVAGGSLAKDFELKNQMNASSGSVMDCIAEGFERAGNAEFSYLQRSRLKGQARRTEGNFEPQTSNTE